MADEQRASDAGGLRCDFCGEVVQAVRRIALDGEYERLRKPHREKYACEACSAEKEQAREQLPGGPGSAPELRES